MTLDQMISLTEGVRTKADKMRVLERAGYARADIARFLGVRYQQVRNTLEGDKRTGYNPEIQVSADSDGSMIANIPAGFRPIELDDDGCAVIPSDMVEEVADEYVPLFALQLADGIFISTSAGMARRTRSALE